jgi:hypothetical protein
MNDFLKENPDCKTLLMAIMVLGAALLMLVVGLASFIQ